MRDLVWSGHRWQQNDWSERDERYPVAASGCSGKVVCNSACCRRRRGGRGLPPLPPAQLPPAPRGTTLLLLRWPSYRKGAECEVNIVQ